MPLPREGHPSPPTSASGQATPAMPRFRHLFRVKVTSQIRTAVVNTAERTVRRPGDVSAGSSRFAGLTRHFAGLTRHFAGRVLVSERPPPIGVRVDVAPADDGDDPS